MLRSIMVALAIALSGCVAGTPAPNESSESNGPSAISSPSIPAGPPTPGAAPDPNPPAPAPWIGVTTRTLEWDSGDLAGPASLSLNVEMSKPGDCHIRLDITGSTTGEVGPFLHVSFWSPGLLGGSGFVTWWTVKDDLHFHAGPAVDSRSKTTKDGAFRSTNLLAGGPNEGQLQFTMAARNLTSWEGTEDDPATGGIYLSLSCAEDFTVSRLRAGREVAMFDAMNLHGGAGAAVGVGTPVGHVNVASASVGDGFSHVLASPFAQFESMSSGGVGGQTLDHPGGQEAFPLVPSSGLCHTRFDGPGGRYQLGIEHAGARFPTYVAALLGQVDVSHPDELLGLTGPG